ncbi:hypothetical protein [Microbacterium testaceum]|uniref:GAF domain-containing protein n=1 Tax=Microbacterium testaceum TaxID=2033 RepID=A0A147FCT5_MICTE|nr:hypothetical protein [Microbacterium testaceum]KTS14403.1 hypothetical protein RSA3_00395 [Microbacterium testaceum]
MTSDDTAIARLTWAWRLAKGWLPQALGALATVFSIIWGAFSEDVWTTGLWALFVAVGLALAAFLTQVLLQKPSYMALAQELRSLEQSTEADAQQLKDESAKKSAVLEQSMLVLLRYIADHCGANANSDRVSVYYFHDDRFVMLARFALHPDFRGAGRAEYPASQGAIGDAWSRGSIAMELPTSRKQWERALVAKHGYTSEQAAALAMHCVGIAALRIEVDRRAVGVIVFESTEPDRVSQATLETAKESKLFAALSELVSVSALLTPRGETLAKPADKPPTVTPSWKPTTSGSGTSPRSGTDERRNV